MGRTTPPQLSLRLAAGDKVLVAGQNGSGKSVWATAVARGFDRVLVYDPKDDPSAELPGAAVVHTARDAARALPGRVLYRPAGAEMGRIAEHFDTIALKILSDARAGRGATAVVVHELGDLGTSWRIGPGLSELIRKGRSLGITAILVTQRPQGIPVLARTEAQHVVCYALLDRSDRDVMAGLMGPAVAGEPRPLDFTWWYRGPDLQLRLMTPIAF